MTHDMFAVWVIHNKDKHWPTPLDIYHSTQVTPSIYSQCHHHHHLHWGMLVSGQPLQTIESMEHRTSLQLTAVFTAVKITSSMIQTHRIGHGKVKELFQVFVFTYHLCHTHDMGSSLKSPLLLLFHCWKGVLKQLLNYEDKQYTLCSWIQNWGQFTLFSH